MPCRPVREALQMLFAATSALEGGGGDEAFALLAERLLEHRERADAAEAHAENAAEASAAATMAAEALRERLVDVEAMLVTSVEATEEEVEANAKAAWEAARALSEEQRAALERATPRERFEKRLDDMDEEFEALETRQNDGK